MNEDMSILIITKNEKEYSFRCDYWKETKDSYVFSMKNKIIAIFEKTNVAGFLVDAGGEDE